MPSDIKNAVTKFLEGSWADQSIRFNYATTFDFHGTDLGEAIREQTERLHARSVELIPWDAERINELLRAANDLASAAESVRRVELVADVEEIAHS